MRVLLGFAGLSVLVGCAATVVPEGETIAIQKLLSDTQGRPYECASYDVGTDTCSGLAKRTVRGDQISFDVSVLVPGPNADAVKIKIGADFVIEGGRYCGNLSRADLRAEGDLSPAERSLLEELLLVELIRLGDVCGFYLRDASGGYNSVTTDRTGRVIPDGVEPVQFFAGPKTLRLEP